MGEAGSDRGSEPNPDSAAPDENRMRVNGEREIKTSVTAVNPFSATIAKNKI
jgi:hypothetical protein